MGVNIYGNYGAPILAFPTSCGDEHEQEGQGMIRTLTPYIEAGRIRIFCINGVQSDSFSNKGAHPFHRSWMQAQYDAYVANEVFPFIDSQCQTPGIGIATLGASLGAYHAANTLFKHPDHVKRCYALSGIYDMRDSMDGMYDDNFYFNNPVDYVANQSDPWYLHQYASCDIRSGNRLWSVGEQRADLPNVGDSQESRHCSSSGRLGPGGRSRMALLASPDVGIRRRTLLKNSFASFGSFSMAKKVTGGCACGSIRYQLLDKPMFVHCCHCDDCQRLTGSAFVLNAIIETQAIKLLRGKPVAVPVPRENGPHDIYRCPRCQTALWSDYGRRPNLRFVRVGTLDKPGALKPDVHIYTRWKAKWLKLPKRTPSFRDYYNSSKLWPKASLKRRNAALGKTES